MNSLRKIIFTVFCLSIFSCVSREEIAYFENIQRINLGSVNDDNNIKIKADDLITVRVNSDIQEAANPFNLTDFLGGSETTTGANIELIPYQVSNDGYIDIPHLGNVVVEGKTAYEVKYLLEEKLRPYLQDVNVTVRIENFQISVLGEVRSPGTFNIVDDHINLAKALGMAGDLTEFGDRQNILILRNENGELKHKYVDLTDAEILNSDFYNLEQNDLVYVEPRSSRRQMSGVLNNVPTYISLASVITSIVILLTR